MTAKTGSCALKHRHTGEALYTSSTDIQAALAPAALQLLTGHFIAGRARAHAVAEAAAAGLSLERAALAGLPAGGAVLRNARMSGADIGWTSLEDADLAGADLRGTDGHGARLANASLAGADLRGSRFPGACFAGADLSGADLRGGEFCGAVFTGANLTGADLRGANFAGVALSGALVTAEQLASVYGRPPGDFLPEGVDVTGWKKCRAGVLVRLRIPAASPRSYAFNRRCRAQFADVVAVEGAEFGVSIMYPVQSYIVGQRVHTQGRYLPQWWEESGHGIHFFTTREEAECY